MSVNEIPKENQPTFGRIVVQAVKRYFENKDNRSAFEKWYLQTYGEPYVWKGESQ